MNGQMYQICSIVAAARRALKNRSSICYIPADYENPSQFLCLTGSGGSPYTAHDVSQWYEHLKEQHLTDIQLYCPTSVRDRSLLGFSNTTQASMVCFFPGNRMTYWIPDWEFDSKERKWNVVYTEHPWNDPPQVWPRFENNTQTFRSVLHDIQDLAFRLGFENFANIFYQAGTILDGGKEYPDKAYGLSLPPLPDNHLRVFEAASRADVFGAMGSWNDSPPWAAHEKGLEQEYETLSAELLKQIRFGLLYAINEW